MQARQDATTGGVLPVEQKRCQAAQRAQPTARRDFLRTQTNFALSLSKSMKTIFCETIAASKLEAHASKNSSTSEFARLIIKEAALRTKAGFSGAYECAVSDGVDGNIYAGAGQSASMREFSRQCQLAFQRPLTEEEIATEEAAAAARLAWLADQDMQAAAYDKAVASAHLALGLSYDAQKALVELVGSSSFVRNNSVDGREIKLGSVKILREESTGYDPMMDRGRGNSGSFAVYRWVDWVPAREITTADVQLAEQQANGVEVVNLTPHPLTIERTDGTIAAIAATGQVARLAVTREVRPVVKTTAGEFAVFAPQLGEIEGLPDPQAGKIYVVSALVADAAKRPDVFSPGELVRDGEGKIVGARGLCAYEN
jgi:hypothetical protein